MRTTPPLRVDFDHSRLRVGWIAASHGATLAVVALIPLSPLVHALSAVLVVALALRALRIRVPAGLVLRQDGTVAILEPDGRVTEATLAAESYTGAWVTTIAMRTAGTQKTRNCLVLPDMLPAEDFRRLRVRLRYAISAEVAGAPASQACASTSAALSPFG